MSIDVGTVSRMGRDTPLLGAAAGGGGRGGGGGRSSGRSRPAVAPGPVVPRVASLQSIVGGDRRAALPLSPDRRSQGAASVHSRRSGGPAAPAAPASAAGRERQRRLTRLASSKRLLGKGLAARSQTNKKKKGKKGKDKGKGKGKGKGNGKKGRLRVKLNDGSSRHGHSSRHHHGHGHRRAKTKEEEAALRQRKRRIKLRRAANRAARLAALREGDEDESAGEVGGDERPAEMVAAERRQLLYDGAARAGPLPQIQDDDARAVGNRPAWGQQH
jgi:hypothetical protein